MTFTEFKRIIKKYINDTLEDEDLIDSDGNHISMSSVIQAAEVVEDTCYDNEEKLELIRDIFDDLVNLKTNAQDFFSISNQKSKPVHSPKPKQPVVISIDNHSLTSKVTDLHKYIIGNCGNEKSVFELKIIGKVGQGSFNNNGSITKWLLNAAQNYNGLFSLDLSQAEGLNGIPQCALAFDSIGVKLKSVYLPDTVEYLGYNAFYGQNKLSQVYYSNKSIFFGTHCLNDTAIKTLTIPEKSTFQYFSIPFETVRTLILPNNFASKAPIYFEYAGHNFQSWDLFIKMFSKLTKIIINSSESEIGEQELELINSFKNYRKNIIIEFNE